MRGGNRGSEAAAGGVSCVRLDVDVAGWVCCKAQRWMSDDPGKADASVCCMEEGDEEAVEAMDCEDVDAAGWSWSPHAASIVHASIAPYIQSILISLLSTASSGRIASRRHAHVDGVGKGQPRG
jgi:hypothetical protein